MEIRANRFENSVEVLADLATKKEQSASVDEFCKIVCQSLKEIIDIDTLILFTEKDSETLEMAASFGRPYARLDEGKYLKRHRKTPVTDAIRLRKAQTWNTLPKIILEYPDAVEWPRIMRAVVAIPIIKENESNAGCVFILKREFTLLERETVQIILEKVTDLIYSKFQGE